jgi:hypothetical protein
MPKPNIKVVIALFESYLAIRKADWNLEELDNGNVTLPEPSSWEGKKVAVCNELLLEMFKLNPTPKKNEMEDWVHLVHELYDHELKQQALFKGQWLGKQHVLLDVIRAMRAYIITCLKTEEKFKKYEIGLKELQKTHEVDVDRLEKHPEGHNPNELVSSKIELGRTNKALESIKVSDGFLNDFFIDQIVPNDPAYKTLKEPDINTFVKNVEEGKRSGILCKKVVESMKKVMQPHANNDNNAQPTAATPKSDANSTPTPPVMTNVTPPKSEGIAALASYTQTPATETANATAPRAPKSNKSGRSALRSHSKFSEQSEDMFMDEEPAKYNLRSKAGNRNK